MNRLLALAVLCTTACVTSTSSEHLIYEPSAHRVEKPQAVIETIVAKLPDTRVTFTSDSFTVTYKRIDPSSALRNQLVPFVRIETIELFSQSLNGEKWFGVLVSDSRTLPLLQVDSLSKDDAQALADAINALRPAPAVDAG